MDAKMERMEAEEERRWQQARTPARPAFDMAKWKQQDYAESARWEQQQAYQRYRQGEWADPQPQKSLWQKAGDWLQQKVVRPVQQVAGSIVNALKPSRTAGSSKLAAPAKDDDPPPKKGWPKWVPIVAEVVLAIAVPSVYVGISSYYGFHPTGALLGTSPDYRGIRIAEQHKATIQANAGEIHPTVIAASIAVQSQWNGFPLDYVLAGLDYVLNGKKASPSFGIAQLTQKQLDEWGIAGTPFQTDVAVKGMDKRIAEVVNACKRCDDTDKLIVAAMAQNGGISPKDIENVTSAKSQYRQNGEIDWGKYFSKQGPLADHPRTDWFNNFRAYEQNYNTQYMLRLFTNDLRVLVEEKGWPAPPGYDLAYLDCLANGGENCLRTTP